MRKVWCWIALWAVALTLIACQVLQWIRNERIEREIERLKERPPKVIFDWGTPEEEDDARRHLDKSDER